MGISFNIFKEWAESRFDDVIIKNQEIRLNSIFAPDDTNHHMWCSPSGGKKKRPFGVYHCFKTDEKGSLAKLVQIVDHYDNFQDAISVLQGEGIYDLEDRIEELYEWDDENPPELEVVEPVLSLPSGSHLITDLRNSDWWKKKAEEYLAARKIPSNGLYVCREKPYKARIIIPYYNRKGEIIYWNSRHFGNAKIRYLGPPKECGVGKSDVVYMPYGNWPPSGSDIYICEGEFNAISLKLSGLYSAACGGKNMDDKQALAFMDYKIILCLDRDKAGWKGTEGMSNTVSRFLSVQKDKKKLQFVRPPEGMGDWNDIYVNQGPDFLREYIQRARRSLDFQAPAGMVGDFFRYSDL